MRIKKIEEENKVLQKVEKAKRKESEKSKSVKGEKENSKGKEKVKNEKSKRVSDGKEIHLIGRKEVDRVLLTRTEPLLLLPTNMCFNVTSPLLDLPIGFKDMLEEYNGIFPKDMPHSLSLLKGIEHHINLTIGASFPNRPAYRANLEVFKEIQKQVKKLLGKG
ncbi:hypothetical protein CR513_05297, partial [Mucuna pruriens]